MLRVPALTNGPAPKKPPQTATIGVDVDHALVRERRRCERLLRSDGEAIGHRQRVACTQRAVFDHALSRRSVPIGADGNEKRRAACLVRDRVASCERNRRDQQHGDDRQHPSERQGGKRSTHYWPPRRVGGGFQGPERKRPACPGRSSEYGRHVKVPLPAAVLERTLVVVGAWVSLERPEVRLPSRHPERSTSRAIEQRRCTVSRRSDPRRIADAQRERAPDSDQPGRRSLLRPDRRRAGGSFTCVKRGGRYWTRTSDFLGVSEAL